MVDLYDWVDDLIRWGVEHPAEMPVLTNLAAIFGVIVGVIIGFVRMLIDYRALAAEHLRSIARWVKHLWRRPRRHKRRATPAPSEEAER